MQLLAAGPEAMDPIRIQKSMFIFGKETPADWLKGADLYEFEPYNWGPFSQDISRDLAELRRFGLVEEVEEVERPGVTWPLHQATATGQVVAKHVAKHYEPTAIGYLKDVRAYTLRHGFKDLLRAVYQKYPEYAVNTVFKY